jgi:hypothetical protein
MRLLADLHISPQMVAFLRTLGHDVVRVGDVLAVSATDQFDHRARSTRREDYSYSRSRLLTDHLQSAENPRRL